MLRINCPFCGMRSHTEFSYLGDATKVRPAPGSNLESWIDYVYIRRNPKGLQEEYWQHVLGCRSWVKVWRDTVTHAIDAVQLVSPNREQ